MRRIIFLDSGPLGLACHNPKQDEALVLQTWIITESARGSAIVIPEIADYEIRRELLHRGLRSSLARLDKLSEFPGFYLPITTVSIRRAAEIWAQARRQGHSTTDAKSIDGDVILAAQALE